MIYTGIGSRETPKDLIKIMARMGAHLAFQNVTLRSGGAPGADTAFQLGCDWADGPKEIYIPWAKFNGIEGTVISDPSIKHEAERIASQFHPAWNRCSEAARKLHTRNVYQILGADLKTPTDFVICWTKDGGPTGGTGQAIRIAMAYGVPVYNLFNPQDLNNLVETLLPTGEVK